MFIDFDPALYFLEQRIPRERVVPSELLGYAIKTIFLLNQNLDGISRENFQGVVCEVVGAFRSWICLEITIDLVKNLLRFLQ